ncbi:MAG: acyl carrier protein [Polyangiaceae bacterium]
MEARVKADVRQFIVSSWLSGDERGFDDQTDMQQTGILDSFSMLSLIAFLENTFDIRLDPADVNAETFRTVDSVARLVVQRLAANGVRGTIE